MAKEMRNFFEQILIKVRMLFRMIETNAICILCKTQPFHNIIPKKGLPTDSHNRVVVAMSICCQITNKRGKKNDMSVLICSEPRRALVPVTARSPWPP